MQHVDAKAAAATAGPAASRVPVTIDIAKLRESLIAAEPDEQFLADALLQLPAGLLAIAQVQKPGGRWPDMCELTALCGKDKRTIESIPLALVIIGRLRKLADARDSAQRAEAEKRQTRSRCNNVVALLAAGVPTDRALAIAGVEAHELDAALQGRAMWSLASDVALAERGRSLLAAREAAEAEHKALAVASSPAGKAAAMREAMEEHGGFANALVTEAGRAWIRAADDAEKTAPNGKPVEPKISFVMPSHQTVGRWSDGLAVPDDVADALARVAVHVDTGLGSSLLAHVTGRRDGALFGASTAALVQAGCPAKLAAATAAWSMSVVNAARPLLAVNRRALDRGLGAPGAMDLMAAARGRAHLEYATSRAGWPAIATALWCVPVELSESSCLRCGTSSPTRWSRRGARWTAGRRGWRRGGLSWTGLRGRRPHGRCGRGAARLALCSPWHRRRAGSADQPCRSRKAV